VVSKVLTGDLIYYNRIAKPQVDFLIDQGLIEDKPSKPPDTGQPPILKEAFFLFLKNPLL